MVKISILVPVYNVEKYLGQCLDSIINQTLKDIEIICINDGSTDNSGKILDEYAAKDSRIRVIHKTNSGYGASMNIGLTSAQGEYIGIVESDDFADKNMFEDLYKIAQENNADLVKSDWYFYSAKETRLNDTIKYHPTNKIINVKDDTSILRMQPSIWSSIYKRDYIERNKISFLETPGASYQDLSFAFKTFALASRIVLTPNAYIYYRQDNIGSSVNSKGKVYVIEEEYAEVDKFLSEHPEISQYARKERLINQFYSYMWNLNRIDKKFYDEFIDLFEKTYRTFEQNNEIDEYIRNSMNRKLYELLMSDKAKFKRKFIKQARKEKWKKFRKSIISLRISRKHFHLALFGKELTKV